MLYFHVSTAADFFLRCTGECICILQVKLNPQIVYVMVMKQFEASLLNVT